MRSTVHGPRSTVHVSSVGHVNLCAYIRCKFRRQHTYSLCEQAMHSIHAKAVAFAANTCSNLPCMYVCMWWHINFKCVCVGMGNMHTHWFLYILRIFYCSGDNRSWNVQTRCKVYLPSSLPCHMPNVYAHLHAARTSKIAILIHWRARKKEKRKKEML